jgi:predicted transcriptional regulator
MLDQNFVYVISIGFAVIGVILSAIGSGIYFVLVKIFNGIKDIEKGQAVDSQKVRANERRLTNVEDLTKEINGSLHDHKNDMNNRVGFLEYAVFDKDGKMRKDN